MKKIVTAVVVCLAAAATSACNFTPVYGTASQAITSIAFSYAEPSSRLEQIVYQDLALRFGASSGAGAGQMKVAVSVGHRELGNMIRVGVRSMEATATLAATVTRDGEVVFEATRVASSQYTTTSPSVLADQAAIADAEERAAKAASESLRLAILASFAR